MSGGHGAGDRRPRRPSGDQPPWEESGRPSDQPSDWPQDQDPQNHGAQGYGAQDYDGTGYADPRYVDRDRGYADPRYGDRDRGYGDPRYGDHRYGDRGYADPGYGPPPAGPAAGPSYRPQDPAAGPQPGYGPSGYDQPGSGPRPTAARYGENYPAGDDSFVPGFGRRDDFGPGQDRGQGQGRDRGPDNGRLDRGGRYPDQAGYDQGDDGRRGADPRWPDPGGPAAAPGGRGPDGRGPEGWGPEGWGPEGWGPAGLGPDPRGPGDRRGYWDEPAARRKKATRWAPRILVLVVFGALLAGIGAGGHYVYGKYQAKYHPADYIGAGIGPKVTVQVPAGADSASIAPTLVRLGIVESARAFTNAAEASANPTGLEPGFFTLNHHMQASLAWAALLNARNRVQLGVTIPEGKRVSQVILILAKETKIPLKNFQQVIKHPAQLGLPSYAKGKVEGYLFPATYAIEPHETALTILAAMVARFNVEAAQVSLTTAAARVGLTPAQVIIEASMAQAEGGSVSDYPKIARVIVNRLKDGMHLQFDSVLLYGLNAYAVNVTDKQIATKGPYNDFEHGGLPPGPISNPGDAAIQGILHPASGDWLYFLTNSGGKSTFSATPLSGQ